MVKKLVRGSVIGIFLGVSIGIIVTYGVRIKQIAEMRNSSFAMVEQRGRDVVETNSDITYGERCDDLQDVVLRFHVKANSNSDEDIALKYAVRDAILNRYQDVLQSDMSREEVISFLEDNLVEIAQLAKNTMYGLGYAYDVKVYISHDYFPIRQYGELVFPAGYYDALRVDIGQAEGENFWCLLYPMMCYPLDAGAVVSNEDEENLKEKLSEEEYEKLFVKRDTEDKDVKIRFKFLEWLGLR